MTNFLLRDVYNPGQVRKLSRDIKNTYPEFNDSGFSRNVNSRLDTLGFGERTDLIKEALRKYLPQDYVQAVEILIKSLGPELQINDLKGYEGFIVLPQTAFVAAYGLEHFSLSMKALNEMTRRFTAEGAIRAFIRKYPERTLPVLTKWAMDKNCHVRRLVSEGTRPRLPMTSTLPEFIQNPRPVLELLELLKEDPELLVRRSVANNINDIAKDNPGPVEALLKRWQKIKTPEMEWMIRHASRNLVKQGRPAALALQGFGVRPEFKKLKLQLDKRMLKSGQKLNLKLTIQSAARAPQELMIDYLIHHKKANGETRPKVFKLARKRLDPGQTLLLQKSHHFRPLSTRKLYDGTHYIELQINGTLYEKTSFNLEVN